MFGIPRFRRSLFALSLCTCLIAAWSVGHAQDVAFPPSAEPDVRLQQLPPTESPEPTPEEAFPEAKPSRAPPGAERTRFVLSALDIEGVTVYEPQVLESLYTDQIGTEISLADVYDIAAEIQRLYRQDGYFLTRAIIPAQTARGGRLRIVVLEGFISEVQIQGDIGPVQTLVESYLSRVTGERPLRLATLERYLLLAKDIPGVQVTGVLRPAPDQIGAAQLVANVERKRMSGVAVIDNLGSSFTKEWEAAASVSTNSYTSWGERLTITGQPFQGQLLYTAKVCDRLIASLRNTR